MRRLIGTAVALGLVAALTWQVSAAQTSIGEGLAVCTRAGADVRAPSSSGSCPSGYTKRTLAEGPLFPRDVGEVLEVVYDVESNAVFDLTYQIIAAEPDGTIQTRTVQPDEDGDLGFFSFPDPLIGTWALGIRILGPMDEDGTNAPFQITTDRTGETSIIEFEVELSDTAVDLLHTVPFVYTAEPAGPLPA